MTLSISAVSKNRKFTKALVRYAGSIDALRNAAINISTDLLPYDTIQIVFIDRDDDYMRPVGCKGDRLFQVEVATPGEETTDYTNEASVVNAIGRKLVRALEVCHLSVDLQNQVKETIRAICEI